MPNVNEFQKWIERHGSETKVAEKCIDENFQGCYTFDELIGYFFCIG